MKVKKVRTSRRGRRKWEQIPNQPRVQEAGAGPERNEALKERSHESAVRGHLSMVHKTISVRKSEPDLHSDPGSRRGTVHGSFIIQSLEGKVHDGLQGISEEEFRSMQMCLLLSPEE